MRALGHALIAAAAVLAAGALPASAGQFNAESFTLKNGLQVVVLPFHRAPAVTQMVWYKVGAADDPSGKSGIAHFLEHLMFRGTKETPPGAFSRIISENGGRDNAFTTEDYTAFYQTLAADKLDLAMKLESERMSDLVITDAKVTPEREVIIEERRTRIDNVPSALLGEQSDAALLLNNHYRLPTIGWLHEMRGLNAEDARRFYRTWYAPNNAILIVAGDVTTKEVRALAEKYYGHIPARPVPAHVVLAEPPKVAATRLEMTSARVTSPRWRRTYLAPSYQEAGGRPADALTVLAELLGGGESSRLYKSLVIEKKLATTVGTGYSGMRDGGSFILYAEPRPGVSVGEVEAVIAAEVAAFLKEGAAPEEVTRVERRLQASAVYSRDSLAGPPRIIGAALAMGRSLAEIEAWPERIVAVTPEQVTEIARAVLKDETAVTAVLLPERKP